MPRKFSITSRIILVTILISLLSSFGLIAPQNAAHAQAGDITLILGAYTTPGEAYGEIIPLFQKLWLDKTGKKVVFQESYQGSGAQSRAIASGFEADIAALSLEADIKRLVDAKLITHDWKANDYAGIVSTSVVALAVRKDNPKKITDWADLTQPGLEILTPDPATSGGAQWNILAALGAAKRGKVKGYDATDEGALKFVGDVFKNVNVMDKGARESILNFEKGVGDVAITYENEILGGLAAGVDYQAVYPSSTILIETPVAVVDVYVDKHGTREVAQAFYDFLWTPEVQTIFAKHGFRPPVKKGASAATPPATQAAPDTTAGGKFPAVADLFTIDYFGGWSKAGPEYFGQDGKVTKAIAEIKGK
jgi:sulfate/thiosulfate transport system substrate-binding protein